MKREKKMITKFAKCICIWIMVVIMTACIKVVPAKAAELAPGLYTVTVVPTYANPDNGVIEDVGQNPSMGNMMVQAQVQSVGFIEVAQDGSIFFNTRWNQPDENVYAGFSTSSDGSNSWTKRYYKVTNQKQVGQYEFMDRVFDATITDFRFQIGSLHDTIRCTTYVEAMDRDCIFYCYFKDPRPGVGNDWNVVRVPEMATPAPAPAPAPVPEEKPEEDKLPEEESKEDKPAEEQEQKDEIDTDTGIVGLEDEEEKDKTNEEQKNDKKETVETDTDKKQNDNTPIFVLAGVAVIVIAAVVIYMMKKKKNTNTDLFEDDNTEEK